MDHVELSKRLRDLSKKGSSYRRTICKMAARKIEDMAVELEKTKSLLNQALLDLKEADVNCIYCGHKSPPAPCNDDDQEIWCDDCCYDCYCKDCEDNSKWEYQKLKEVNQ